MRQCQFIKVRLFNFTASNFCFLSKHMQSFSIAIKMDYFKAMLVIFQGPVSCTNSHVSLLFCDTCQNRSEAIVGTISWLSATKFSWKWHKYLYVIFWLISQTPWLTPFMCKFWQIKRLKNISEIFPFAALTWTFIIQTWPQKFVQTLVGKWLVGQIG